jgi:hypothetical protein
MKSIEYVNCRYYHSFVVEKKRLCNVTDIGLAALGESKSLTGVDITGCKITADALVSFFCKFYMKSTLNSIVKCELLKDLQAFACPFVNDQCLEEISKIKSLKSLDIAYCRNISELGIGHLSNCTHLETLSVVGCRKGVQEAASRLPQKRLHVIVDSKRPL